jgi:hypothetical protein
MEAETLETPPIYVNCTPQQWAEAKAAALRERLEPFHAFMEPFAATALEAQMITGNYIDPVTAVHYRDVLDARGYKPKWNAQNLEQRRLAHLADKAAADKVRSDWEQEQREKRSPFRFRSLQQAAALLSPVDYNEYCLSQEGQLLAQAQNKTLHGFN